MSSTMLGVVAREQGRGVQKGVAHELGRQGAEAVAESLLWRVVALPFRVLGRLLDGFAGA